MTINATSLPRADFFAIKCCIMMVLSQLTTTGTLSHASIYSIGMLSLNGMAKDFNVWINDLLNLDSDSYNISKNGGGHHALDG